MQVRAALLARLARYRDFFALFEDFGGYVDFFLLQDLVTDDCADVRFFMPFDEFRTASVPEDDATSTEYRRRSMEFIEGRNRRIITLPFQASSYDLAGPACSARGNLHFREKVERHLDVQSPGDSHWLLGFVRDITHPAEK